MKKIPIIILSLFIFGCSNKSLSEKYFDKTWIRSFDDKVGFENGDYHGFLSYDSKNYKFVGDTVLTYHISDSLLIIQNSQDASVRDTFIYDFKNYFGPKLIVMSINNSFDLAIFHASEYFFIKETNNINYPRFEIDGYSIGDTINISLLDISDTWEDSNIKYNCELKSNFQVEIDIIGDNYIYNIDRDYIKDSEVDAVVKSISSKLGTDPKYTSNEIKNSDYFGKYFQTSYTWNNSGIYMRLYKSTYIDKPKHSDKYWNLSYDNTIIQSLLIDRFPSLRKSNSIIE